MRAASVASSLRFGAGPIAGMHFWNFTSLAGGPAAGLAEDPVRDQSDPDAPPPSAGCLPGGWSDHHHHHRQTHAEAHSQRERWMLRLRRAGAPQKPKRSTEMAVRPITWQQLRALRHAKFSVCVCVFVTWLFIVHRFGFLLLGLCKRSGATKDDGRAESILQLFPLPSARLHCG